MMSAIFFERFFFEGKMCLSSIALENWRLEDEMSYFQGLCQFDDVPSSKLDV